MDTLIKEYGQKRSFKEHYRKIIHDLIEKKIPIHEDTAYLLDILVILAIKHIVNIIIKESDDFTTYTSDIIYERISEEYKELVKTSLILSNENFNNKTGKGKNLRPIFQIHIPIKQEIVYKYGEKCKEENCLHDPIFGDDYSSIEGFCFNHRKNNQIHRSKCIGISEHIKSFMQNIRDKPCRFCYNVTGIIGYVIEKGIIKPFLQDVLNLMEEDETKVLKRHVKKGYNENIEKYKKIWSQEDLEII